MCVCVCVCVCVCASVCKTYRSKVAKLTLFVTKVQFLSTFNLLPGYDKLERNADVIYI